MEGIQVTFRSGMTIQPLKVLGLPRHHFKRTHSDLILKSGVQPFQTLEHSNFKKLRDGSLGGTIYVNSSNCVLLLPVLLGWGWGVTFIFPDAF